MDKAIRANFCLQLNRYGEVVKHKHYVCDPFVEGDSQLCIIFYIGICDELGISAYKVKEALNIEFYQEITNKLTKYKIHTVNEEDSAKHKRYHRKRQFILRHLRESLIADMRSMVIVNSQKKKKWDDINDLIMKIDRLL